MLKGHNWEICRKCGKFHGHHPKGMLGKESWCKGLSKETNMILRRVSEKTKGRIFSEEHRRKLSYKKSEEHKQNLSLAKLGKKRNDEFRKKCSERKGERSPMFGKHLSEEARKKISENNKGCIAWNKGKSPSLETRMRMSETAKKRLANPMNHNFYGKHRSKETIEKLKNRMITWEVPFKNTNIEIILQNKMREMNIPYTTQKNLVGKPDIFIEPNFCIFADGCYWHKCSIHFPENYLQKIAMKDNHVNEELKKRGYYVLRFWEHDIKNNPDGCIQIIKEMIESKLPRPEERGF